LRRDTAASHGPAGLARRNALALTFAQAVAPPARDDPLAPFGGGLFGSDVGWMA
jgi:hypothetical protein